MGNLHLVGRGLNLHEKNTINLLGNTPHTLPKPKAEIFKNQRTVKKYDNVARWGINGIQPNQWK